MLNFDELDKVSSVICKPNPTLTVKHVVRLSRMNPSDGKMMPYAFIYDTSKFGKTPDPRFKNPKQVIGMSGTCDGYVDLESNRTKIVDGESKTNKIVISILPRDMQSFLYVLDKAYKWLTDNTASSPFVKDMNGRPAKVKDPMLKVSTPLTRSATGLSFKPCIIRDDSDVRYEGITMGNKEFGEITNFTAQEFTGFKVMVTGVLENLYIANMTLTTQAMSYVSAVNTTQLLRSKKDDWTR